MKVIGITGGSGFVGKHLSKLLIEKGYQVVIFSRNPEQHKETDHASYVLWDPENEKIDTASIMKLTSIVHLAGAGIADKRWTTARKKELVDSRVKATNFLMDQLKSYAPHCHTMIAASASGFYGPDRAGASPFKEESLAYDDFLGKLCVEWEKEEHKAEDIMRTVILRFGIVLGKESGAFKKFEKPMRYGIMPILGNGEQMISWIEVDDLCRMVLFALEDDEIEGTYNAATPYPVSNKALMQSIAKAKGGVRIPVPVPSFMIRLLFGELSIEVLKSTTLKADKIIKAGFEFQFDTIDKAVRKLIG